MSKCEVLLDELKAYVDGELPLVRRAAIGAHVSHCPACRAEVEVMERMSNELKAGDVAALPADLRDRLIAVAPESAVAEAEPEIPLWRRRPMQIWAGAAIGLAVWFVLLPVFLPVFSQAREKARLASGGSMMKQIAYGGGGIQGGPTGAIENGKLQYTQDYDEAGGHQSDEPQRVAMAPQLTTATPPAPTEQSFSDGHARRTTSQWASPKMGEPEAKVAHRSPSSLPVDQKGFARSISRQEPPRLGGGGGQPTSSVAAGEHTLQREVKKTGELTIEVTRLEAASDSVEEMVKESGGYVANNQLTTGENGIKAASLDVRVPVNLFDAMLSKFSKLGEVKARNVTGEDLTEQISDEKQAKRALGDELEESRQKLQEAKSRKDKREADQEVRDLKVQIAQAEGRLELLKKQARLSTISISLREKSKAQPKPVTGGFMDDLKDSGREALASFTAAARVPFVLIVWALAYSPVWVPLAFGYRYAAKAHRKKVEVAQWQARRAEEAKAV